MMDPTFYGEVYACAIEPDFSKLTDLEKQRAHLISRRQIFRDHPPALQCFAKKAYKSDEENEKALQKVDYKIDEVLDEKTQMSRFAYLCLDTPQAVDNVIKKLDSGLVGNIQNMGIPVQIMKQNFVGKPVPGQYAQGQAGIGNEDAILAEVSKIQADPPTLDSFVHPTDINWANIRVPDPHRWWKKLLLLLLSIVVLIFFTTPAALINTLSRNDTAKGVLSLGWVDSAGPTVKFIFQGLTPAIIVLIVNAILLLILSKIVDNENHHRFSLHQLSLLKLVYIYLLFNMLIVPGFAASAVTNLLDLITRGVSNVFDLFKSMFVITSGDFFLILIIQSAGNTFLSSINDLPSLIFNYLSPRVTLLSRFYERSSGAWQTENGMIYGYGVNYAQSLVIISIAVVFQ